MKKDEKTKAAAMPSFDLVKLVKACLKSWRLFALSIIVCTGLAAVFAYLKLPTFQVDAQLMLKDDAGSSGMMMYGELARSFALGDMLGMGSSTDNEVAVIQSHTVFMQTARDLSLNISYEERVKHIKWASLYTKSPLSMEIPPLLSDTLSVPLTFKLKRLDGDKFDITLTVKKEDILSAQGQSLPCTLQTPYGDFTISPTQYLATDKSGTYRIGVSSYDAAAEAWQKLITVFAPNRKTDFIGLSVVTGDPEFGKRLLDTLIENYNDMGNDEKHARSNSTLNLVNARLATLQDEMAQTEHALEEFKRQNQITEVEYDAQFILNKKSGLETALLKAQTETEILRMTLDFVKNDDNAYELVPDLLTTGALSTGAETARTQIAAYNELILERMRMAGSAREGNAALRQLDQQLAAMRANIVTSVQRAYDNARVELSKVQTENDRAGGRISSLPALERQYIELRRVSELQNQMYLFLLQQKEEITLSLASRTQSAVTIDAPHVLTEPVGLTKKKILIIGFLLGGLLALALVYFTRLRREPFSSAADIEDACDAPVLAVLQKQQADGLAVLDPDSPNAETYRRLRSDLLMVLKEADGHTVLVTSTREGEGKTTVAVNLAAAMALAGKRTLLIDSDTRHPAVAPMLGIDNPSAALAAYAAGGSELDIRTVSVGAASLDVVTSAAGSGAHCADFMASDHAASLIAGLRSQYDCIVVDTPSLQGHSDVYEWAPLADVTLVTLRTGVSNPDDATAVNGLYADGRLPRIAIVANC